MDTNGIKAALKKGDGNFVVRVKVKITNLEGLYQLKVPEEFLELPPQDQIQLINETIREMRIDRIIKELNVTHAEAVQVIDAEDIFGRPLVEKVKWGDTAAEIDVGRKERSWSPG